MNHRQYFIASHTAPGPSGRSLYIPFSVNPAQGLFDALLPSVRIAG